MKKKILITIVIFIILFLSIYFIQKNQSGTVGGNRDESGCLIAGGYTFDEEVGACIKSFEMTPDIMEASKTAVNHVGREYALTVVSFNSYEKNGSYDITLEKGEERNKETVYIRNWEVIEPKVVKLFFYNQEKDLDEEGNIQCSKEGLVAVEREVVGESFIEETIRLLIEGSLSTKETGQGIETEFPLEGLNILSANLMENGELILTFEDPQNKTSGGSCRVSILRAQIEETAKQFGEVKTISILPEELFQP